MVKHFRIKADELYEMHVTVFGMDREDCWDKISGTVQGIFGKFISKTTGLLLLIVEKVTLITS